MYTAAREEEVRKVMKETGMDYLQAYRHVQQRTQLVADARRNPTRHPLGKSQSYA